MLTETRREKRIWATRVGQLERERALELAALRTQVANRAASLAEIVTEGFEGFHMGAGDYVVELMAPHGPSTGSGARARQNIRLVPRRRGYAVIVAGSVDPVASTAEVRTFEHVAIIHEVRFARPVEITADEYADFSAKLDVALNLARVRATRIGPPLELLARRRTGRATVSAVILFAFVLVLAAFVVYRVMCGLHR